MQKVKVKTYQKLKKNIDKIQEQHQKQSQESLEPKPPALQPQQQLHQESLITKTKSIDNEILTEIHNSCLVLAYNYALSPFSAKHLSIGYSIVDFKPCVLIREYSGLLMSDFEFRGLECKISAINAYIFERQKQVDQEPTNIVLATGGTPSTTKRQREGPKNVFRISPYLFVQIGFDAGIVKVSLIKSLKKNGNILVRLDHTEWLTICLLSPFLLSIMGHLRKTSDNVKTFYEGYVQKCAQLQTPFLDEKDILDIIAENPGGDKVNYSRLHIELSSIFYYNVVKDMRYVEIE